MKKFNFVKKTVDESFFNVIILFGDDVDNCTCVNHNCQGSCDLDMACHNS